MQNNDNNNKMGQFLIVVKWNPDLSHPTSGKANWCEIFGGLKIGGNLTSEGKSRLNHVEFRIQLISLLTYPMLKIDE